MERLSVILKNCTMYHLANGEQLYSVLELKHKLANCAGIDIIAEDCSLVPFYYSDGKRMEIYEYELIIRVVERLDSEESLQSKTGETDLSRVSKRVKKLHEVCYIPVLKNISKYPPTRVLQYIAELLNDDCVKEAVRSTFGEYFVENMMFAVYV